MLRVCCYSHKQQREERKLSKQEQNKKWHLDFNYIKDTDTEHLMKHNLAVSVETKNGEK